MSDEQSNRQGEELTVEQAQTEINTTLRNSEHPYHIKFAGQWKSGHEEAVTRMEKLYSIVYREPSERSEVLNDGSRGLGDTLRKEGFKDAEEISQMGEEARQAVKDERLVKLTDKCVETLRGEWGMGFNQSLALVKDAEAHLLGSRENQKWLSDSGIGRDAKFISMFHTMMKYIKDQYGVQFKKGKESE